MIFPTTYDLNNNSTTNLQIKIKVQVEITHVKHIFYTHFFIFPKPLISKLFMWITLDNKNKTVIHKSYVSETLKETKNRTLFI